MKLRDAPSPNWPSLYNYASTLMNMNKQDGEDIVHSAWASLVERDADYNNQNQAMFFFRLRIKDLCINSYRKKSKETEDKAFYTRHMSLLQQEISHRIVTRIDSEKIINYLNKKGKRFGDIFNAMLDIGEVGTQAVIAKEIGITPTNFKVQLIKTRILAQGFVGGAFIKPNKRKQTLGLNRIQAREWYARNKISY